jgi:ADP-L-glycero-D-manno-heptose 6-epimerase
VTVHFALDSTVGGLFNCGASQARTWIDLAQALFAAMGRKPDIRFIDLPEILRGKYQYFTQADSAKLRKAGYTDPFASIEDGVRDYVKSYLEKES